MISTDRYGHVQKKIDFGRFKYLILITTNWCKLNLLIEGPLRSSHPCLDAIEPTGHCEVFSHLIVLILFVLTSKQRPKKKALAGLESTWMTRPAWQSSLHPFYSILNSLIPRIKLTYASIGLKNCHIQLNKITIRSSTERWMGRENKLTDIGVIYSHLLQNLPLSKKPSKSSFTTGASQNHIIASHE